ncbi:MAG: hypothetical protein JSV27_08765 [Candidatus Bathyarchaeota archaeon]|nr:MAG: hypothetical protein JSV27_08765 [Candidatus Bathyarchaeota archaeon]
MSDDNLRLMKLIEHWAEHNDEHGTRFQEAAEEAAGKGLVSVAENLRAAAEKAEEVSRLLRKALEAFN